MFFLSLPSPSKTPSIYENFNNNEERRKIEDIHSLLLYSYFGRVGKRPRWFLFPCLCTRHVHVHNGCEEVSPRRRSSNTRRVRPPFVSSVRREPEADQSIPLAIYFRPRPEHPVSRIFQIFHGIFPWKEKQVILGTKRNENLMNR